MADQTEKVLFEIRLDDEQYKQEVKLIKDSLVETEKQINATKEAQKKLNDEKKAGKVTDDEYARQSVALRTQLRGQQADQRELQKGLETVQKTYQSSAGSINQLRARLAEVTIAYNAMSAAERDSSEEGKKLQAETRAISDELKKLESRVGDTRRNVGNYAAGFTQALGPIVVELAKIREQQKGLDKDSEAFQRLERNAIGFQTAAAQAAAKTSKSYEEGQKQIENYARSVQPAVESLVKLEQEQARLVESGEETTESFRKIGFQIAATQKQLAETPLEVPPVPEIKVPTGSLEELAVALAKIREQQQGLEKDSEAFQVLERQAASYQVAATAAGAKAGLSYDDARKHLVDYTERVQPLIVELVKLEAEQEQVGDKGSEAYEKLAFQIEATKQQISKVPTETKKTGSALLDLAKQNDTLSSTVDKASTLQQNYNRVQELGRIAMGTSTGAARVLKIALLSTGLGAFVALVGSLFVYFTQTAEGGRILETVMARIGATVDVLTDRIGNFGKAVTQLFSGEYAAAAETARKSFAGIGDEINRETKLAGDLSKARQQLVKDERALNEERAASKATVESLKFIAEDTTKSTKERIAAAKEAFRIEIEQEGKAIAQQKQRLALIEAEVKARGDNASQDQLDKQTEARIKLYEIQEAARTRQIELNNKVNEIQKSATDAEKAEAKAAADAAAKAREKELADRRAQLKLQNDLLDLQLKKVAANSNEELSILQRKLKNSRNIELAQKDLTIGQKKLIDQKYEADSTELLNQTLKRRAAAELQAEVNNISARLAAVQAGGAQELALQQQLIEQQRQQQLNAIGERLSVEDRAAQERLINANAEKQQNDLLFADRTKQVVAFYQQERNELERARAQGLVTEEQYQATLYQQELASVTARIVVAERFNQDVSALNQERADLEIANLQRVTEQERAQAQYRAAITQEFGALVGEFLAGTIDDASAALENFAKQALLILLDEVQKTIIAAQVKILVKSFEQADSIATFGATGGIRAALIIGALAAATAPLKAALTSNRYATGGLVTGPGGPTDDRIPAMLSNGEGVMTARAVSLFGPLLSAMNVAGGGVAFKGLQAAGAIPVALAQGGGPVRYDASYMDAMRQPATAATTSIDYDRLADSLAARIVPGFRAAVESLPTPQVDVNEISRKQNSVRLAEQNATL